MKGAEHVAKDDGAVMTDVAVRCDDENVFSNAQRSSRPKQPLPRPQAFYRRRTPATLDLRESELTRNVSRCYNAITILETARYTGQRGSSVFASLRGDSRASPEDATRNVRADARQRRRRIDDSQTQLEAHTSPLVNAGGTSPGLYAEVSSQICLPLRLTVVAGTLFGCLWASEFERKFTWCDTAQETRW